MAQLGNNGDVSVTITTPYDGKGVEQAKRDMESFSLKMRTEFEKASSPLDRVRQGIGGVKAAWAEMLVAYGAVSWLASAAAESLQAEIGMRKLRTQIEHTGVSWSAVSAEVDAATQASARYGRVQQEEVVDSMRQLVWATGDYQKAMENLNLVQDLAYQTNMSTSEATRMVGLALTGNLEVLGRMKPEFRNLDEILGQHRTTADEVAYFYAVMREKVEGATQAMTEQEKMARDLNLFYKDLQQSIGGIVNEMNLWAFQMLTLKGFKEDYIGAAQAFQNIYNAFKYGEGAARAMTGELHPLSQYIEETTKKTEKSSKEVAAEARARAEQAEKLKKTAELNKSVASTTEGVRDEINKLRMDEQSYYAWKLATLVHVRGVGLSTAASLIAAEKELAESQASERARQDLAQAYEAVEEKVLSVEQALAKQKGATEDLLTIEAQQIVTMGATSDQLERYLRLREAQILLDDQAREKKRADEAEDERKKEQERLKKEDPYAGHGGQFEEAYKIYAGMEERMSALKDYNARVIQEKINSGAAQYEIEAEYERLTTAMKRQEYGMRLGMAASFSGGMANFFQNLYVASGKNSRKLFELGKAFAIAEAVMNTAKAATMALSAPPGPPISFAYVAAAIAAGAAQIATISSTQPGGGGVSASGGAMPSYAGGSYNAYPVEQKVEEKQRPAFTIVIEKAELMGDDALGSFALRLSELVKKYDVELIASRTV